MKTEINTLQNRYEIYNFALTVSSTVEMLSAVQDICGRPLFYGPWCRNFTDSWSRVSAWQL